MVEKILRINHKDVMARTDPVTRKMAKDNNKSKDAMKVT